jgi:hypothetical protein
MMTTRRRDAMIFAMRFALVTLVGLGTSCGFQPALSRDAAPGGEMLVHDAPIDMAMIDAPPDTKPPPPPCTVDATPCTAAGGVCMGDTCVIDAPDNTAIVCPAMKCRIECNSGLSCRNGITCDATNDCTVNCNVQNSCQVGDFNCALGCRVYCRDANTCDNSHYDCGTGTNRNCDLQCCDPNACVGNTGGPVTLHGAGTGNGTCP